MFIHHIKSSFKSAYSIIQEALSSGALWWFSSLRNICCFKFTGFIINKQSKERSIVSKHYAVAAAITALFFAGCQKEKLTTGVGINSSTATASSSDALVSLTPYGTPSNSVNYGALICPPNSSKGWLDFQQNVAAQLGITCLRGSTTVPGTGNPLALLTASYDILLNFNTSCNQSTPSPFVSNLIQYKIDLNNILALCAKNPAIAVIENEESNRYYYSGTAQDYIKQLNAAISVMHAKGIKVANGGITDQGLNYLVYQDFLSQGKNDSAQHFKDMVGIAAQDTATINRGAFVDVLLTNYAAMNLDYVNFHWKAESPDTEALREVINYLKKRTNKPIISNELGQFDNDQNTLLAMMKLCTDQRLAYVVWYSPNEKQCRTVKATPLQNDNAALTATGNTYKRYLAQ